MSGKHGHVSRLNAPQQLVFMVGYAAIFAFLSATADHFLGFGGIAIAFVAGALFMDLIRAGKR